MRNDEMREPAGGYRPEIMAAWQKSLSVPEGIRFFLAGKGMVFH